MKPRDDSTEYASYIEETIRSSYDVIARRPWRLERLDRAWMLKASDRGAAAYGVPPGQVHADLKAAMRRRSRNVLWVLSVLPGVAYALGKVIQGVVLWRVYAGFLGARYVRQESKTANPKAPRSVKPSPPSPPAASVVMLSHGRLPYVRTTLDSLHAMTDRSRVEIIAVDNGSTDGTAEYLKECADAGRIDRVILRSRNHGTSAGFNIGFASADPRSRFLVKLDSDIVLLTPGWLERFERFFEKEPRVGVLCQTQINHAFLSRGPKRLLHGESVTSWNWFVCGGACMTIPRPVFEDVGWLNEEFDVPYMPDDLDYAMRLSYLGYEAYYLQGCVTYHRSDLDRRSFRSYGRGKILQRRTAQKQEAEMYRRYASRERDPRLRYERYERSSAAADGAIRIME